MGRERLTKRKILTEKPDVVAQRMAFYERKRL
jgi:hypothetical protein